MERRRSQAMKINISKLMNMVLVKFQPVERVYSIIEDYDKFLKNQEFCDIIFVVENEEIPAHKQILIARNEVFAKMFTSKMLEKETSRVEIIDIESKIFKLLLRFIYCGKIGSIEANELQKLILAADKYSVENLVNICGNRLFSKLSIENAVHTLMIADLVRINYLKKNCIDLILKYKDKVIETEGYKEMVKSGRIELLSELFQKIQPKPNVDSRENNMTSFSSYSYTSIFYIIVFIYAGYNLYNQLMSNYHSYYCKSNYNFF